MIYLCFLLCSTRIQISKKKLCLSVFSGLPLVRPLKTRSKINECIFVSKYLKYETLSFTLSLQNIRFKMVITKLHLFSFYIHNSFKLEIFCGILEAILSNAFFKLRSEYPDINNTENGTAKRNFARALCLI